jgi:hypothetical protein
MQRASERWKPNAMYLTTFDGRRPLYVTFDLDASDMPPFAEPFFSGLDADPELAPVMNTGTCGRGCSRSADADQSDRCPSQSSAAWATSRQPWSIVSECPRSGNSTKSVMAGDLW